MNALRGREFMAIIILLIVTFNEFNVTGCDNFCGCSPEIWVNHGTFVLIVCDHDVLLFFWVILVVFLSCMCSRCNFKFACALMYS